MTARVRRSGIASWQVTLALALFFLGFFIAAQIRAQATSPQYTTQERQPLLQSIRDLQAQHDTLTKDIARLRDEIDAVRQGGQGGQSELAALNARLRDAEIAAGFLPITGPGGYLFVDDGTPPAGSGDNPADYRVQAADLRLLVDALWESGAEALAINDERVVTSTAIIDVGGAILVNSAYITKGSEPYRISVIGPNVLWERISKTDAFRQWAETRYALYRLPINYATNQKVLILGFAGSASLRAGRVVAPSPSPAATPSSTPTSAPSITPSFGSTPAGSR